MMMTSIMPIPSLVKNRYRRYLRCMSKREPSTQTLITKIIRLPSELAERISNFRFEEHIKTEADTMRLLLERGLEHSRSMSMPVKNSPKVPG